MTTDPVHAAVMPRAPQSAESAEYEFASEAESIGLVRAAAAKALAGWGIAEETVSDVLVMLSELASNVVVHGAGPIRVRLDYSRWADTLIAGVTDDGPGCPCPRTDDVLDEGGRGLMLVGLLATEWGVTWGDGGKTVWFRVDGPAHF
jgi:Anti-sigma regulatory factor (Ser/Thr protein kinase)